MTEKQNVFNTPTTHDNDDKSVASSDDEIKDEKERKDPAYVAQDHELFVADSENVMIDPFVPFDDLPPERERIVTFRAMLVGCICGALVNASSKQIDG